LALGYNSRVDYLRAYVDAACAPEISSGRDFEYLSEAIYAGLLGAGWQSPNPVVGALVVKEGEVISRAAHRAFGKEHAEAAALSIAKERASGADLYVSLEPCTHTGKQPPCTSAIISAGISRVIYGGDDPDARTCHCGRPALEAAGMQVSGPLLPRASVRLNDAHYWKSLYGKMLVTLRMAVSLDGKVALPNGISQWLTGKIARGYTHYLRQTHDAVLVGLGTVRADNPRLTVRRALLKEFAGLAADYIRLRNPVRAILDPEFTLLRAYTPPTGSLDKPALNIFVRPDSLRDDKPWLLFVGGIGKAPSVKALAGGIEAVELPQMPDGLLELARVWEKLESFGISSLMVEGGADTARSVLEQQACLRMDALVAPVMLGDDARGYNAPLALADLDNAPRLNDVVNLPLGRDTLVSGYTSDFVEGALRRMGQ
jgi:diaminohydroxyphosphoribosylaminopyrimidine deaminase/5-amino-6-(5-phosphoribosylamino)uracil reductase